MARWQRRARLVIAVFGIAFAVFVARQFKGRTTAPAGQVPVRTDPSALVEAIGGQLGKFLKSREDVRVGCKTQTMYEDGTSKCLGVTIVTDERNGSRTFTITAKEGKLGKDQAAIDLAGDVRLEGSDGMTLRTEHATYADADATVRSAGPVEFSRHRMSGNGTGMTWEKARDVLTILDQAVVHIAPDEKGAGAADVTSMTAAFARRDKYMLFERNVRIERGGQVIESETALAHLSDDEKHIETVELHGGARITTANATAGGLQSLTGHDMNLKYNADGESIEHALVTGSAQVRVAGEKGKVGRQIEATTLDIALAPDGTTPTSLVGREAVQLTFPPEAGAAGRTIRSAVLEAKGEPGRGLSRALFTGNVQFRERGTNVDRAATAASLDVALKPGMSAIEEAKFARGVRFEEGSMAATAAAARYDLDNGTLELSGSEPGAVVPHLVNAQIVVDATKIDVTLEGPKVAAAGNVKSELKPAPKTGKPGDAGHDTKMPSMLKQDQPVNVIAGTLDYDGTTSKASYTDAARLFQGDTTIKGETLVLDNKAGNLTASGNVTTTTILDSVDKDKKKERSRSIATAKDLAYDDATRRLTYTGGAHMTGPEGDMTATRIELFLKPSGDELERAEAYEGVTLREQHRETTGTSLVYTTEDEKYVVMGVPVKIVDECQRETTGRTLTFIKSTDTIVVDGNAQIRTQTRGGNGKCSS